MNILCENKLIKCEVYEYNNILRAPRWSISLLW